jgi:hypothetical protein
MDQVIEDFSTDCARGIPPINPYSISELAQTALLFAENLI